MLKDIFETFVGVVKMKKEKKIMSSAIKYGSNKMKNFRSIS